MKKFQARLLLGALLLTALLSSCGEPGQTADTGSQPAQSETSSETQSAAAPESNVSSEAVSSVKTSSAKTSSVKTSSVKTSSAKTDSVAKTSSAAKPASTIVYSGQTLKDAGRPVYNNDMEDDYSGEKLTAHGVNYTFPEGEALRSVLFEAQAIDTQKYNTVTFKIRSLTNHKFYRFRLYIYTDLGGNLKTYREASNKQDFFIEYFTDGSPGTNENLVTVSGPDSNGWVTVTMKAGEMKYWKNGRTIEGFRIGWVDYGTDTEISEVVFSKK